MRYALSLLFAGCQRQALQEGQVNPMLADVQRMHAGMLNAMGGQDAFDGASMIRFDNVRVDARVPSGAFTS